MLEDQTWKRAREQFLTARVALIPVGSTEQHGPHLPLGTDFMIAQALAREAARRTGAICTPTIPVGISEHHRQFWGTLWVAPEAFRAYLAGIARSLAYHGLRRLIFVNGHGGNTAALREVARALHQEGIYALTWQWWPGVAELIAELFPGFGSHAGEPETAMMLAIAEELVDKGALEEAAAEGAPRWGLSQFGAEVAFDASDFSRSGAVGDPRRADREKGLKLYEASLEQLIGLIRWLEGLPEEKLRPGEHKP